MLFSDSREGRGEGGAITLHQFCFRTAKLLAGVLLWSMEVKLSGSSDCGVQGFPLNYKPTDSSCKKRAVVNEKLLGTTQTWYHHDYKSIVIAL